MGCPVVLLPLTEPLTLELGGTSGFSGALLWGMPSEDLLTLCRERKTCAFRGDGPGL